MIQKTFNNEQLRELYESGLSPNDAHRLSQGMGVSSMNFPSVEREEKKDNFFKRVTKGFQKRGEKVTDLLQKSSSGELIAPEAGFRVAGQFVAGGFDILGEGLVSAMRGASNITPDFIENRVKELSGSFVKTKPVQAGLGALGGGVEKYQGWAEENPRQAGIFEAVVNLSLIPLTAGGASAAKPAVAGTARAAAATTKKASVGLDKSVLGSKMRTAVEVTRAPMKAQEKTAGFAQGRGEFTGITRKLEIKPTALEKQIAKEATPFIKKNDLNQSIRSIKERVKTLDAGIEAHLAKHNAIFNTAELRAKLNTAKEGNRLLFAGDRTIERAYDAVADEIIRLTIKKDLKNLFKARKEFDKIVRQKFPTVFDGAPRDRAIQHAILDVRKATNQFIAEKLPVGAKYTKPLNSEFLLLSARDGIAGNLTKQYGSNIVKRAIGVVRSNPIIATGGAVGVGFGLGTGTIMTILTSPVMVASLVGTGFVKIGQKTITSDMFRNALRGIANKAKIASADKQALDALAQFIAGSTVVGVRDLLVEEGEIDEDGNENTQQ